MAIIARHLFGFATQRSAAVMNVNGIPVSVWRGSGGRVIVRDLLAFPLRAFLTITYPQHRRFAVLHPSGN